jgi:hypothetical protein
MKWYEQVKDKTDWNFREEFIKYCRADVDLLSQVGIGVLEKSSNNSST